MTGRVRTRTIPTTKRGEPAKRRAATAAAVSSVLNDSFELFEKVVDASPPMTPRDAGSGVNKPWATALVAVAAGFNALDALASHLKIERTDDRKHQGEHVAALLRDIEPTKYGTPEPAMSEHQQRLESVVAAANSGRPELGLT